MHKTIDLFGEFASTSATLVGDKNGYGLLSPQNLDNLWQIYYYPNFNLTSKESGQYYDFHDLCERPYPGFPYCNSELTSLFSLFNNEPSYWADQEDINDAIQTDDGQNILAVCQTLYMILQSLVYSIFLCSINKLSHNDLSLASVIY